MNFIYEIYRSLGASEAEAAKEALKDFVNKKHCGCLACEPVASAYSAGFKTWKEVDYKALEQNFLGLWTDTEPD